MKERNIWEKTKLMSSLMLVILIEASVLSSVICAQDSDVYEGNPQEFSSGFLYDENKRNIHPAIQFL